MKGVHNPYCRGTTTYKVFSIIFLFMPSATYFLSPATKSRQKMPLSNAEGLAQRKSFL